MEVLVFATNVTNENQVGRVNNLLTNFKAIADWSFDLEDCDNILRVVGSDVSPRHIEVLLQSTGVKCNELED